MAQKIDKPQYQVLRKANVTCRYPMATKTGIEIMVETLIQDGAMCPKCGYGTRVTSKRWAKCKNCGNRIARNGTEHK